MEEIYTNNLEIRFFGLRRSGNHAIINWLGAQSPHQIYYLDCCPNDGGDPFRTGKPTEHRDEPELKNIFCHLAKLKFASSSVIDKERRKQKKILLYSYEDFDFKKFKKYELPINREQIVGKSKKQIDILLLRDIYNWLASKLFIKPHRDKQDMTYQRFEKNRKYKSPWFKYYSGWEEDAKDIYGLNYVNLDRFMSIYKGYAKEILNSLLLQNMVFINFNRWFIDKEYRKEIIESIGFSFTDKGKDIISRKGGGSSFDGYDYDGCATKMDMLERWKYFKDNNLYWYILEYFKEEVELSNTIFGNIV